MLHTNKNVYLLNDEDYKSRAPTGSDHLSQKIMTIYFSLQYYEV